MKMSPKYGTNELKMHMAESTVNWYDIKAPFLRSLLKSQKVP